MRVSLSVWAACFTPGQIQINARAGWAIIDIAGRQGMNASVALSHSVYLLSAAGGEGPSAGSEARMRQGASDAAEAQQCRSGCMP